MRQPNLLCNLRRVVPMVPEVMVPLLLEHSHKDQITAVANLADLGFDVIPSIPANRYANIPDLHCNMRKMTETIEQSGGKKISKWLLVRPHLPPPASNT